MPPLPGQQAPLASSAFCLDCLPPNPLTTSVDQNAEGCSHIPPPLSDPRTTLRSERSSFLKEKESTACLITMVNRSGFLC